MNIKWKKPFHSVSYWPHWPPGLAIAAPDKYSRGTWIVVTLSKIDENSQYRDFTHWHASLLIQLIVTLNPNIAQHSNEFVEWEFLCILWGLRSHHLRKKRHYRFHIWYFSPFEVFAFQLFPQSLSLLKSRPGGHRLPVVWVIPVAYSHHIGSLCSLLCL